MTDKNLLLKEVKEKTIIHHQNGMNGAQAVLQALMDCQILKDMPELISMTSSWKGGIAGDTCSAYGAATLLLGLEKENKEEKLKDYDLWFKEKYHSLSCTEITDAAGGRPSKEQKVFCDNLSADTAAYLTNLRLKENGEN